MEPISLTDFVDFVLKVGSPKLTQVRKVKNRADYHPATDYWKPLREGLVEFHENGSGGKNELDAIVERLSDEKKVGRYSECIAGYKRFLGKKSISWIKPSSSLATIAGLQVRVNPEIGLNLNGRRHIIKLHFKRDALSKRRAETILLLMKEGLGEKTGTVYGVLDVPSGKLHATDRPDDSLLPLLLGEAASFKTMWEQL